MQLKVKKTKIEMDAKIDEQHSHIKFWMLTSRLGPRADAAAAEQCSAEITANFGSDTLKLEKVRV